MSHKLSTGMSEQIRYLGQWSAEFEKMGRAGVAQGMRPLCRRFDSQTVHVSLSDVVDRRLIDSAMGLPYS